MNNHPFKPKIVELNKNARLHILDITEIDEEFKNFIDSKIVNISEGNRNIPKEMTKQKLLTFLNNQDHKTKMGAIGEFFTHLYLKTQKYKQECLFFNLEENSIKKGFDGYYSKKNVKNKFDEWIMESKSTEQEKHKTKIKDAYTDLKNKLAGKSNKDERINNPWNNAYNHAKIVDTKKSIINNIEKIDIDFRNGEYKDIKDFNIIPSATVFLNCDSGDDSQQIEESIKQILPKLAAKQLEIICITQKTKDLFLNYLKGDN